MPKIETMLRAQREFTKAANRCLEKRRGPGGKLEAHVFAGFVCGAFALEVGLKALLESAGTPYDKIHNLAVLFGRLSQDHQERLIQSTYGDAETEFRDHLDAISNVYWRYSYEEGRNPPKGGDWPRLIGTGLSTANCRRLSNARRTPERHDHPRLHLHPHIP
jgi:HEPN domain-containing protein